MFSFIKKFSKVTLHKSCEIGNIKAVRQHLADGADVNATHGYWTTTPLHCAAYGGYNEVVELLIENGADVNAKIVNAKIENAKIENAKIENANDVNGMTPLHEAAFGGYKEIAELLIAKGADVNAKSRFDGTPLDEAVRMKCTETAELLRKHGGKTSKELKAEGK
jgi:cytohesin